jgi:hypothetical protein
VRLSIVGVSTQHRTLVSMTLMHLFEVHTLELSLSLAGYT